MKTTGMKAVGTTDVPVIDYWSRDVEQAVMTLVGAIAAQTKHEQMVSRLTFGGVAASLLAGGTDQRSCEVLAQLAEVVATIEKTRPDPRRRLLRREVEGEAS